jgi:hypothetical protein
MARRTTRQYEEELWLGGWAYQHTTELDVTESLDGDGPTPFYQPAVVNQLNHHNPNLCQIFTIVVQIFVIVGVIVAAGFLEYNTRAFSQAVAGGSLRPRAGQCFVEPLLELPPPPVAA